MKFALTLLGILIAACTAGSLIPQKEVVSYYTTNYPRSLAGAIMLLQLDDVFHCWWFVGLTVFLCLNLLACNILRFPSFFRRMKEGFSLQRALKGHEEEDWFRTGERPEELFRQMGFRNSAGSVRDGRECVYAARNKAGIWGAWLCHLGMLVIIIGFGFGEMFQTEYTVYGVAGQTKVVGDTDYALTIDDFEIILREDDTVEQYVSKLTMADIMTGERQSGETRVNAPLSMFGLKFYQNSTGWAADVAVYKGEKRIQVETLCTGEAAHVEGLEDLAIGLRAFYPDYGTDGNGNPVTKSSALKNPAYLYMLYFQDSVLGMNVLTGDDVITVEDYTFVFGNPRPYTLIQIKKDPFSGVAALGALLVIAALLLAFYVRPEELWAVKEEDGTWRIAGRSRKSGAVYREETVRRLNQFSKGGK